MKPSHECLVDVGAFVVGEDHEAGVLLDSLPQTIDLDVGVTVVAIMHLGALSEKRIRFVEKENRPAFFRRIEDAIQIFLCLANVFGNDGAQIDAV